MKRIHFSPVIQKPFLPFRLPIQFLFLYPVVLLFYILFLLNLSPFHSQSGSNKRVHNSGQRQYYIGRTFLHEFSGKPLLFSHTSNEKAAFSTENIVFFYCNNLYPWFSFHESDKFYFSLFSLQFSMMRKVCTSFLVSRQIWAKPALKLLWHFVLKSAFPTLNKLNKKKSNYKNTFSS